MLGKLMKHEFKSIGKVLFVLNLILVLVTIVGCLTFISPLWTFPSDYTPVLALCSMGFYYIVLFAVVMCAFIYCAIRFYRNLYTDQGYLMHTLPVTSHQLILSKLIPAFTGVAITFGCVVLSVVAILSTALVTLSSAAERQEFWQALPQVIAELYGMSITKLAIYLIVTLIIGGICGLLQVYAAISLGQLFSGHKVSAAVASYVGIYFVLQILSFVTTIPVITKMTLMDNSMQVAAYMPDYMIYIFNSCLIVSVVLSVVFYVITHVIMSKKVNLD